MKAIFLLAVFAVLGMSHSEVVEAPLPADAPLDAPLPADAPLDAPLPAYATPALRYNLNIGHVGHGDRLLHRSYVHKRAIANAIQHEDYVLRTANSRNRITAILANEVGHTQYATPNLLSGGLGHHNYVTIRLRTARGHGYFYLMEIWGR